MHRASRFVTLYEPADAARSFQETRSAVTRRHRDWEHPAEPDVQVGDPPAFNRMDVLADGSLSVDFVSRAPERWVSDGFGFARRAPIHHDWVTVLPGTPPIVEVGGRTIEQRDAIFRSFRAALGLQAGDLVERAFSRPGQWQALQAVFGAQIFGHSGNRRVRTDPLAYSMHAGRTERLDDLPWWQLLGVQHERARELGFSFTLTNPIDGYPEVVVYYIRTATGQIKFLEDISEYARRRVLDEYIAIARRP
jgi:hypothetical protein